MALFGFTFSSTESRHEQLPDIFPMLVGQRDFVAIDCETIYSRILTDTLERTTGLNEDQKKLLWDNCLASETQDGLVSLVAKAMVSKYDLYLVYRPDIKVIRKATSQEESQIRADYAARGESAVGVFITFRNYKRTDMVKLYSALEYCGVNGFWKMMNLSKALQLKFTELRSSTGLSDSADVKAQARAIAEGLSLGKDVMLDAKDVLDLLKPDMSATNSAMDLISQKRSFYLGLPASYMTGESKNSMGDTGEGDAKKVDQGLRGYYFSIVKPVIEGVFGISTTFKSEDFRQISNSMEVLKTFEITSDEYISKENKQAIVNKVWGLPEDAVGDEPQPIVQPLVTSSNPV